MPSPSFRFVCGPAALAGGRAGWAREMLADGEVALLADDGVEAVNTVAHDLGLVSVPLIRGERTRAEQERTVIAYAASLPLVWIAPSFEDETTRWAHDRGPMTLLIATAEPLTDDDQRRIDRFVATLGRQSE
ncbi:MAG TPA: hypothetical protein VFW09_15775 [Solirubrobacteraceae bacterium]|jgi:hypothetical protein|nr:hypothetical protein [Solirubrobacteraceae bacterium]